MGIIVGSGILKKRKEKQQMVEYCDAQEHEQQELTPYSLMKT